MDIYKTLIVFGLACSAFAADFSIKTAENDQELKPADPAIPTNGIPQDTFDKPPGGDIPTAHCLKHEFTVDTPRQKAEFYLQCFFEELQAFIDHNYFYFRKFQRHLNGLRQTLSIIEFFVETCLDIEPDIDSQVDFVRLMFGNMVYASEKMDNYNRCSYPGADLVDSMVELNIRLFFLYNRHGQPDMKISGYDNALFKLYCYYESLEDDFKQEDSMLYGMRKLYTVESVAAKITLTKLGYSMTQSEGYKACPFY